VHLEILFVSGVLIEDVRATVVENTPKMLKIFSIQKSLDLVKNHFGGSVGSDMVPSDFSMYGCQVKIVMKKHGGSEVDSVVVDLGLHLPIGVGKTERGPVEIFNALELSP
jgi:hypothetical protein